MSAKSIFSAVLLSGTILFLTSCSADDETASKPAKQSKKAKELATELDGLLLAPPELSLSQAIKRYVRDSKRGQTAQMKSRTFVEAAERASDMGDNDAAVTLSNEALRFDDQNGDAYFQRGRARCNAVSGKDDEAIEDMKKAISLGRGGTGAHQFLARLYDANKQPEKAIEVLTVAVKIAPQEKDLYKARAAIYASTGEKEKSLKDYDQLSKLDPESLLGHFRKAQVLESMNKYDEARASYEKLVSLDEEVDTKVPLKPLSYKRLAALNSIRGKHEEAIAYLNKASKLDDTDDEPFRLRGLEYAKLKNYKKAIEDLTKAIDVSPESKGNFESRAEVYTEMGKADLAEKDRIEAKRLHDVPAERPVYDVKSSPE